MNLSVTVPSNWQKDSFEVWMHKIRTRLQKQRYDQLNDYPEMLKDKKVRIINN